MSYSYQWIGYPDFSKNQQQNPSELNGSIDSMD